MLTRAIVRPLQAFLDTEVSGGVLLLAATIVALTWANSPWSDSYEQVWTTRVGGGSTALHLPVDLRDWINEGLMTVFFFVVGLEIKRELTTGEMRTLRRAALPAIAAVGGMAVPALIYLAFNAGSGDLRGWGIPMATDIAFAVSVLAVVGKNLPGGLRIFLLALAIFDDIAAILVIAFFYAGSIEPVFVLAAFAALLVVPLLRRFEISAPSILLLPGIVAWLLMLRSGVHPTIAGVALAMLMASAGPHSPLARLEGGLHPWTSFAIVPLFALANAGVSLAGAEIANALSSPVALGVFFGLVIGKLVGITGSSWLAVRLGVARLPEAATWPQLAGVSATAGIGFTVALFVAALAFPEPGVQADAKIGVLVGSLLAGALGAILLRTLRRRSTSAP
ncbi:MAG: Na+/H+ antiporter NhaA [Actinomycetota bacterium]